MLRNARPVKYGAATDVAPGVRVTFLDAGHIPGSASILFEVALGVKTASGLVFRRLGQPAFAAAAAAAARAEADAVFVEAT